MSKYLDLKGIEHLWGKIKESITDATTGTIPADRLQLKTINCQSIKGTGNIAIDLTLYKIVTELPTTNIDKNKIYLVANSDGVAGDSYSEYIYNDTVTPGAWELLGQYKADVNLGPYVKKTDIANPTKNGIIQASEFRGLLQLKNHAKGFSINDVSSTETDVKLNGKTLDDWGNTSIKLTTGSVSIPAATTSKAGVMTKSDKTLLTNVNTVLGNGYAITGVTYNAASVELTTKSFVSDTESTIEEDSLLLGKATITEAGVMGADQVIKLNGIAENATFDSAITEAELNTILV